MTAYRSRGITGKHGRKIAPWLRMELKIGRARIERKKQRLHSRGFKKTRPKHARRHTGPSGTRNPRSSQGHRRVSRTKIP